jgi:hypothetical protein
VTSLLASKFSATSFERFHGLSLTVYSSELSAMAEKI